MAEEFTDPWMDDQSAFSWGDYLDTSCLPSVAGVFSGQPSTNRVPSHRCWSAACGPSPERDLELQGDPLAFLPLLEGAGGNNLHQCQTVGARRQHAYPVRCGRQVDAGVSWVIGRSVIDSVETAELAKPVRGCLPLTGSPLGSGHPFSWGCFRVPERWRKPLRWESHQSFSLAPSQAVRVSCGDDQINLYDDWTALEANNLAFAVQP